MKLNEIMENIKNGENVTALKKEFCKALEELSNDDFLMVFSILGGYVFPGCDDLDDCDCGCGCDNCDCEDDCCDCE